MAGVETDPLIEQTDDHNDDDDYDDDYEQEVDTTTPFQPDKMSTPPKNDDDEQYEMQTMPNEQSGFPETSYQETSFFGSAQSAQERAWGALKGVFPDSSTNLEACYSIKGKLQVKMAGFGKKIYDLFTTKKATGKQQLNPKLSKEILRELGPMAQEVVKRDNEEIRRLKEDEKKLKNS